MNELIGLVEAWAIEKGLHLSDPSKQLLKTFEEIGELTQAFTRNQYEEMQLELGDLLVTIIVFAMQNHLDIDDCLQKAYDKISKRTGKMVDGIFVKSEDLPSVNVKEEV